MHIYFEIAAIMLQASIPFVVAGIIALLVAGRK